MLNNIDSYTVREEPAPLQAPLVSEEAWLANFDTARLLDAGFELRHGVRPLLVVGAIRAIQEEMEKLLPLAVAEARLQGESWGLIGQALKVSRQAASQRFGDSAS